jgi:hypothetical protein
LLAFHLLRKDSWVSVHIFICWWDPTPYH